MSESIPHLKLGAERDFFNILKSSGQYEDARHNKSDRTYQCEKGLIEFFSAENSGKVHGPRRDILYVNECNNVNYETVYQASMRTRICTFLDFNPVRSFWVHEDLIPMLKEEDYAFIKSTYRDNNYLDAKVKNDIERRALIDDNFRRVYAEGEIGSLDGLIFTNWELIDDMPKEGARSMGMDFGFTNDPTTLVDIRKDGRGIYVDELLYRTGMTNQDIGNFIKTLNIGRQEILCDDAEPKSIEELFRMGINCKKAGKKEINHGIQLLQQVTIFVTKRSVNLIKELRNYQWKKDKNGKAENVPIDTYNHLIDATRYGAKPLIQGYTMIKNRIIIPQ